jgi:hypothetical protein
MWSRKPRKTSIAVTFGRSRWLTTVETVDIVQFSLAVPTAEDEHAAVMSCRGVRSPAARDLAPGCWHDCTPLERSCKGPNEAAKESGSDGTRLLADCTSAGSLAPHKASIAKTAPETDRLARIGRSGREAARMALGAGNSLVSNAQMSLCRLALSLPPKTYKTGPIATIEWHSLGPGCSASLLTNWDHAMGGCAFGYQVDWQLPCLKAREPHLSLRHRSTLAAETRIRPRKPGKSGLAARSTWTGAANCCVSTADARLMDKSEQTPQMA